MYLSKAGAEWTWIFLKPAFKQLSGAGSVSSGIFHWTHAFSEISSFLLAPKKTQHPTPRAVQEDSHKGKTKPWFVGTSRFSHCQTPSKDGLRPPPLPKATCEAELSSQHPPQRPVFAVNAAGERMGICSLINLQSDSSAQPLSAALCFTFQ